MKEKKTIIVKRDGVEDKTTFQATVTPYDSIDDDFLQDYVLGDFFKLDFRENREFRMPTDLDFNWGLKDEVEQYGRKYLDDENIENYEKMMKDLEDNYYYCYLDCYIHGNYNFSLAGEGINCHFDTSRACGIIAIKKEDFDGNYKDKKPYDVFREVIEKYSDAFNGRVYEWTITKEKIFKSDDGEVIRACSNIDCYSERLYIGYEQCKEMDEDIKSTVERLLKDDGVKYDEVIVY